MSDTAAEVSGWLAGRLPDELFVGAPEVSVDREEITIVGTIAAPDTESGADPATVAQAEAGRIARFRETTRDQRIEVAREAEHRFDRKVAWGVRCGESAQLFTHLAVPVMTRLRQPQRQVLDTLVSAGVARSRADALAWCVKLVGQHTDSWLTELRTAMDRVDEVRSTGPVVD
ncbi:hypothetical protein VX037_06875 [Gordonia sp. Z-3]|jgi:hypothetical protein|uniref:Uncharacterized protein n=2 Tax=Gordonia TaxID=2053 RepID=A0A9X3I5S0_9ACTN|nr:MULTISPECIES: hypothetical protein [Gordonia]MAU84068.1 hypothetical protein [Gordonia sp. (in: high G+C Gram-positive bacteria)]MCF3937778.1 hypothetical protein [Gordonia tangerina]MCX2964784.1 hypothetical protein [Gordonia aquimaris]MED5800746.1 hypothetical protein [Gordonia sp. Z-3]